MYATPWLRLGAGESWLVCAMHIDPIPNRNSRPAYLLRESVRDGKHVRKRTLANLSSLPIEQIEAIRRILKGERLGPVEDGLEVVRSRAHGHVEAVLGAMRRLGFDTTLADELGIADADEDALYAAMDWLVERQEAIEKRLARRHLKAGGLVLFDLTSSYFEGERCPLARIGYSRVHAKHGSAMMASAARCRSTTGC